MGASNRSINLFTFSFESFTVPLGGQRNRCTMFRPKLSLASGSAPAARMASIASRLLRHAAVKRGVHSSAHRTSSKSEREISRCLNKFGPCAIKAQCKTRLSGVGVSKRSTFYFSWNFGSYFSAPATYQPPSKSHFVQLQDFFCVCRMSVWPQILCMQPSVCQTERTRRN